MLPGRLRLPFLMGPKGIYIYKFLYIYKGIYIYIDIDIDIDIYSRGSYGRDP